MSALFTVDVDSFDPDSDSMPDSDFNEREIHLRSMKATLNVCQITDL